MKLKKIKKMLYALAKVTKIVMATCNTIKKWRLPLTELFINFITYDTMISKYTCKLIISWKWTKIV